MDLQEVQRLAIPFTDDLSQQQFVRPGVIVSFELALKLQDKVFLYSPKPDWLATTAAQIPLHRWPSLT